ncbi:hypothetical protein MKX03_016509, partial [Papaver bracteatum]
DTIVGGGSPNIGSGEVESLTGIRDSVVELESLEHYKSKCFELPVELENRKLECTTDETEQAPNVTEWSGELDFTEFLYAETFFDHFK